VSQSGSLPSTTVGGSLAGALLIAIAVIICLLRRRKSHRLDTAVMTQPTSTDIEKLDDKGTGGSEIPAGGRIDGDTEGRPDLGGRLRYPDESIMTGGRIRTFQ
jgi:hypothetical protein